MNIERNEPNILLTRVDNRLVHGQVGITWTKTIGANVIIVANDETADNILQQKLMSSIAHAIDVQIRFFTLQYTSEIIYEASAEQRIYIVVNTIRGARILVEKGVPIKELNLGNLHYVKGKRPITKKVYVSEEDVEDIAYLLSKKVRIFIQDVPGDSQIKIHKVEDLKL